MVSESIHAFIHVNLIMMYLNLGTMRNCSIWVFFQTLLKITTITYNGCLMRNEEGFWILQANYLQVHTCKVTRCASFSCLFSCGVGSIQGLTEIYSRHNWKACQAVHIMLKATTISKAYMESCQTSGIQTGLSTAFICHLRCPDIQKLCTRPSVYQIKVIMCL